MDVIQLKEITKHYCNGQISVLEGVSLDIRKGEILCIAGENGAGKTTLMKIIYGMEQPNSGSIFIDGTKTVLRSPLDAAEYGIGMVHQHFMLIDGFTVAQNVTMGQERRKLGMFTQSNADMAAVQSKIDEYGLELKADQMVEDLTVGQMQQVEILRLLYRNCRILILDEPTSVLTEKEVNWLFSKLRDLASSGRTIILITHKLNEIKNISDRVAVLRKGRISGIRLTGEVTQQDIAMMMFDSNIVDTPRKADFSGLKKAILTFDNVEVRKNAQKKPLLSGISFQASSHEILGFCGVAGNGLGVLEGAIGGFIRTSSGRILHLDDDITGLGTRKIRRMGFSYVPANRMAMGSCPSATVRDNLIPLRINKLSCGPFLSRRKIDEFVNDRISRFSIDARDKALVSSLSGGNIQKMILSREIMNADDFILFSQPTWGLDYSSGEFVHSQIRELRDRGVCVIVISYNLDEILAVSDRIIVLSKGRMVAQFFNDGTRSKEEIGELMLGKEEIQ